jgi:hypothetical protein
MVGLTLAAGDVRGRTALVNTFGRLFEGLSDIAKAVLIILVADTMLGWVGVGCGWGLRAALRAGRRAPRRGRRGRQRKGATAPSTAPAAPALTPNLPAARAATTRRRAGRG